jgi:hypothetical protein
MRSPEKIKTQSAPVITDWAAKFSVAKKNANPTVTTAPLNSTNQTMPGTTPAAATRRALLACVTRELVQEFGKNYHPP